ncbi:MULTISPECIES: amino acid ABC transporter permease [unclassified Pseudoclavibacter]|jgi:glutamate transport system permease protein|uniref:amino acid ABC transporter permease n=1 Tax=unclassified Pseudoclavibacter TaxID=2615177 RepID=UPI000CE85D57|nr:MULTISPECIES: amino acid ABC transporter permease [unclassified Pseudoclavibacter]MBS3179492.1 amino acid ABC transporter permease [Pseudoclavibacter sp. Marseille-Q4354]NYF14687.1 glutamate transport system permease protein [Pseudoclavibacter sp. JAI123]PPG30680.1 amino acid ABC transporter permease [Pseudoclavibacter sp. RFBB5]PPG39927.1 amino acid ABC transporter permease [Pseudoclavibacter sp. RFBA6]
MSQTSVLYDVPGPRALARNKLLGIITVVVIVGLVAFLIYRLGATGNLSANKWQIFGYAAIWTQIAQALWATLSAFLVAAVGALALGFVLAIGRLSDHAWVRIPFTVVVEGLRAIPVLILMMLMYYGLPAIGIKMEPFWAVVIALIAYNGSVLSEVIRSGVQSLPSGQAEAGYAIGLRKSGVMQIILLPQAIRAMLPVIIAQLVVTLKDTALGSIITYNELLYMAKLIGGQADYGRPYIPVTIVIGAIYIATCVLLSWLATIVQKRISQNPKVIAGAAPEPLTNAGNVTDTELILVQQSDVLELEEDERQKAKHDLAEAQRQSDLRKRDDGDRV